MDYRVTTLLFWTFLPFILISQDSSTVDEMTRYEGFFNSYYSEKEDRLYLEVTQLDAPFIYVSALSEGVGSNDLGLDRGQIGGTRIVSFRKAGNKLLLVQPNLKYRTITANGQERRSVEEAFAKSVLFGFPIYKTTERGYIIDLTPFLIQDVHGVTDVLKAKGQGTYKLDPSRSALNLNRTKSFPRNVDFDAIITLSGASSQYELSSVTPNTKFVTVFQHHSFVALPDDDFKPRKYYPNCGAMTTSFYNYAAPIDEPMEVVYCNRHRLEKVDPKASVSAAVAPIIYYLDNGTPEPVRSVLLEGAAWWNEAFEAIGYKDAFQVRMLPDTIDPLDVRYNVIQWVHRSTRGWSYGGGVVDPRTGEIIKGHVSLGSLRVRQDYKIATVLSRAPFDEKEDQTDALLAFALARIRQLSAHEVGHTLGFAHNFAASTNNRASVMDYPHPLIDIRENEIDLRRAYDVGIGEWDKVTVAYTYSEEEDEATLQNIIDSALSAGYRFASDGDARPLGGAHAYGHLWDNGENAADELEKVLRIRAAAIEQFGKDQIRANGTLSELEDLFVLLYFYHRYQTEAAVKLIGGLETTASVQIKNSKVVMPVARTNQKRALDQVLRTLTPEVLLIPGEKLKLFPPRPAFERGRESFKPRTAPAFDPLTAASTAADFTLQGLLNAQRINRLISQKIMDSEAIDLTYVLNSLTRETLYREVKGEAENQIQISVNEVVLNRMMQSANDPKVHIQARAETRMAIWKYQDYLKEKGRPTAIQQEHIRIIERYFRNPEHIPVLKVPKMPDGSPIGQAGQMWGCDH